MKLSEAIRLGARLGPQAFGRFINAQGDTCALGGALKVIGCEWKTRDDIIAAFPVLGRYEKCPRCGMSDQLMHVVMHMNDMHRWTREAIADLVETIEAAQSVTPAETLVGVLA